MSSRIRFLLAPALLSWASTTIPSEAQTPQISPTAPPAAAQAQPLDAAARKAVVDRLIAMIQSSYVFPDKAAAVAKALRRKLASGDFDSLADPKAFTRAVNDVIRAVANDKHLGLSWSPEPLPPPGSRGEPDPGMMERFQAEMRRTNYAILKAEVLDGNIGYLKMNMFAPAQDAGATLAAAMAFLRHSDALIFDLRENGGGDPGMVAMALSYLIPPQTEINRFHQRGKPVDEQVWSLPYVPGGRWSIDKPVYVLTSKETGSAAEEFAYDLQQMKRGTVIGGSTWGGANPGDLLPIDGHFAVFVPTGAAVNPISKTNWEGVGVQPDVAVDPAAALDTARRLALEKLSSVATGDRAAELRRLLRDPAPPAAKP